MSRGVLWRSIYYAIQDKNTRPGYLSHPMAQLQETLIAQGAKIGHSLGEPDVELIERIGVLPESDNIDEAVNDKPA